jgi:hypothetical protein
MDQGAGGPWKGKAPSLEAAFEEAWATAKEQGAGPGRFVVESIEIETENPIRTYVVIIGPGG